MRLSGALGAVLMTVLSNLEGTASFENVQCLGAGTNCTTGPAHICSTPPLGSWLAQDGVRGYVPTIMRVCRCPNITFSGPMCDKECPHGHSNPCNGHGECLFASSTCACDFGWQGERPLNPQSPTRLRTGCRRRGIIASKRIADRWDVASMDLLRPRALQGTIVSALSSHHAAWCRQKLHSGMPEAFRKGVREQRNLLAGRRHRREMRLL
jgi:hypothetical protein